MGHLDIRIQGSGSDNISMDTARKTDYRECHITHNISDGKECYSKASLTVDHDDKKMFKFKKW